MFSVETTPVAFETYLGASFDRLDHLQVIDQLLDFYEGERATDCAPLNEDGDLLLFQWGEGDEGFHLRLTRQLIGEDADGDQTRFQLIVDFHFDPTDELEEIEPGSDYCMSPEDLGDFREALLRSPAYEACFSEEPVSSELRWEEV